MWHRNGATLASLFVLVVIVVFFWGRTSKKPIDKNCPVHDGCDQQCGLRDWDRCWRSRITHNACPNHKTSTEGQFLVALGVAPVSQHNNCDKKSDSKGSHADCGGNPLSEENVGDEVHSTDHGRSDETPTQILEGRGKELTNLLQHLNKLLCARHTLMV